MTQNKPTVADHIVATLVKTYREHGREAAQAAAERAVAEHKLKAWEVRAIRERFQRELDQNEEKPTRMFRILDGNDSDVLGAPVGEDNVYIRAYGATVRGEKPVASLDVGESTFKRYSLSGQRPTVYKIVRVS